MEEAKKWQEGEDEMNYKDSTEKVNYILGGKKE